MVFQNKFSRSPNALDLVNRPLIIIPTNTDPRDSLKQNTIKPKKNFNTFNKGPTPITTRSITMFHTGMIENVRGQNNNCSSCGGAK